MDSICKRAFDPQYAFFLATAADGLLAPNPASHLAAADHLDHFVFLGRILGKAIFENILVEPQFAGFFLNKLLGRFNYVDDLGSLDPDLHRNLVKLKDLSPAEMDKVGITFDLTVDTLGERTLV